MRSFELTDGESVYLDFVRGVAAQVVVVGHGLSMLSIAHFLHEPNVPWMQNVAVLIFFILSGFIITWSVQRKAERDSSYGFRAYFIDRFSRIYSALVPALLFVLMIDSIVRAWNPGAYGYENAFSATTFFCNIFMLQDHPFAAIAQVDYCTMFGSARPFWSLAIEWWIYLFYGFLVLHLLKQKTVRIRDLVALAILSIVPVKNAVGGNGNGLTVYWIFGMLGCLLYPRYRALQLPVMLKALIAAACLVMAVIRVATTGMDAYEPLFAFFVGLTMLVTLDLVSTMTVPASLEKLIRWNAGISYTLYLVHYSVLNFLLMNFATVNPWMLFVVGFVVSNVVAFAIGSVTEFRLTRAVRAYLRNRCLAPVVIAGTTVPAATRSESKAA